VEELQTELTSKEASDPVSEHNTTSQAVARILPHSRLQSTEPDSQIAIVTHGDTVI